MTASKRVARRGMALALVIACTSSCITTSPAKKPYAYVGNVAVILLGLVVWRVGADPVHGDIPALQVPGIITMIIGGVGIAINATNGSGESPPPSAKKKAKRKTVKPEPTRQTPVPAQVPASTPTPTLEEAAEAEPSSSPP